ncbi:hypothetical protein PBCVNEJV1_937L [Paramecium bursaria Chlorella virus NE-JV-1]|nr:hypothetical protein PBCVNEJV1_937L [Paramecium bursaria Chlorella virus NE-JV-1]
MTHWGARSAGLSGMLMIFLLGRIVIDAAEHSVISEKSVDKSDSRYDPDSDSD